MRASLYEAFIVRDGDIRGIAGDGRDLDREQWPLGQRCVDIGCGAMAGIPVYGVGKAMANMQGPLSGDSAGAQYWEGFLAG